MRGILLWTMSYVSVVIRGGSQQGRFVGGQCIWNPMGINEEIEEVRSKDAAEFLEEYPGVLVGGRIWIRILSNCRRMIKFYMSEFKGYRLDFGPTSCRSRIIDYIFFNFKLDRKYPGKGPWMIIGSWMETLGRIDWVDVGPKQRDIWRIHQAAFGTTCRGGEYMQFKLYHKVAIEVEFQTYEDSGGTEGCQEYWLKDKWNSGWNFRVKVPGRPEEGIIKYGRERFSGQRRGLNTSRRIMGHKGSSGVLPSSAYKIWNLHKWA